MMDKEVLIRTMQCDDIEKILLVLQEAYMIGREEQYRTYFNSCYEQNQSKDRVTLIAFMDNEVVGYVNIIFKSKYPYFMENNIPEINDLYVVPAHRKSGIGKRLLEECERSAVSDYKYIGLGVGLYKDYGSAQRLYTKNGYRLDGNGLMYNNIPVAPGNQVYVDDDLLLYLYKDIR
jgi:GNAT superfamily N-acetyltransferase